MKRPTNDSPLDLIEVKNINHPGSIKLLDLEARRMVKWMISRPLRLYRE